MLSAEKRSKPTNLEKTGKMKRLVLMAILCMAAHNVQAGLVGSLSNADGLISGGKTWSSTGEGLTVMYEVSQNTNGTWHYEYSFTAESGKSLKSQVSHFIISVSPTLTCSDVFNFTGDFRSNEIGTWSSNSSNPNFPDDQSMFGMKIDLGGQQTSVSFDSVRAPMWGDFYAKGGGNPKNYAYNTDFGVQTLDLYDYVNGPVDMQGNGLSKILVPDTYANPIPEPATMAFLGLGFGCLMLRKRR